MTWHGDLGTESVTQRGFHLGYCISFVVSLHFGSNLLDSFNSRNRNLSDTFTVNCFHFPFLTAQFSLEMSLNWFAKIRSLVWLKPFISLLYCIVCLDRIYLYLAVHIIQTNKYILVKAKLEMAQTLPFLIFKPEPSRYEPPKVPTNEGFPGKDRWHTSRRGLKVTQHIHCMHIRHNLIRVGLGCANPSLSSSPDSHHCYSFSDQCCLQRKTKTYNKSHLLVMSCTMSWSYSQIHVMGQRKPGLHLS